MADHNQVFPIEKMSAVFKVSRSGYYRWLSSPPSARATKNQQLNRAIHRVWEDSGRCYGSPRIHQQLLAEGWSVSRQRIARLMRKIGIASRIRRKWVATTDSKHSFPIAPNLLDRKFWPARLGQVWVSDITYLPSEAGWLYLTTVMDLADRQVIGWSLSKGLSANQTVIPAWKAACQRRPIARELIFHSDRGIQYACKEFTEKLKASKLVTQSMSRKGNCWDNAPAESFFRTLKAELRGDGKFAGYQHARQSIFTFIELWYNRKRLHSALAYRTPAQTEQLLIQNQAA